MYKNVFQYLADYLGLRSLHEVPEVAAEENLPTPAPPDPRIGTSCGNYRILSQLGEGGMGRVYLAEHPQIRRKAVVKMLHPEIARDPGLVTRFINEGLAASAIRHPNIIEIFDAGHLADGTPYILMEYLAGESMAGLLARERPPVRRALQWLEQAASALTAAHAQGITHRDLKPDNLFLIPDARDPSVVMLKVLDFGIAKLQGPMLGDSQKTKTGMMMGTPAYMSPEQWFDSSRTDHRSDIYSLGIIAYEALSGAPPFVAQGFGELMDMHRHAPVDRERLLRAGVPEPVSALVVCMLAKTPEQRPQSMEEVRLTLQRLIPQAPSAPPSSFLPATLSAQQDSLTGWAGDTAQAGPPSKVRRKRLPLILLVAGGTLGSLTAAALLRPRPAPLPAAIPATPSVLEERVPAELPPPASPKPDAGSAVALPVSAPASVQPGVHEAPKPRRRPASPPGEFSHPSNPYR